MGVTKLCDTCGATVEAPSEDDFGAAFLTHARAKHDDWSVYPDLAVVNYGEALLRLTGPKERLAEVGSISVEPMSTDRLDDWLRFFDHEGFADNPAWAACYCTEPHCLARGASPADDPPRPWADRRRQMIELLGSGRAEGYLAYIDGRVAGWVNASKRSECAFYAQGPGADPADAEVISVACFVIAPPYRRHGVAAALLAAVIEGAPGRGASWIEGYPQTESKDEAGWNFRGPRALFDAHGFEPAGEDGTRTVMRRAVEHANPLK